jgi:hypothetical protein
MIEQTLKQLQNKVQTNSALDQKSKEQVLDLLADLKAEVEELSETNRNKAESITGYAGVYTHEALSIPVNTPLLDHSLLGLNTSIEEFEGSHPKLISTVNAFCARLSSMGL